MAKQGPIDFFRFFYRHLGQKVYVTLFMGVVTGLLDGVGVFLFIPLLRQLSADEQVSRWVPDWNISTILLLLLAVFVAKAVIRYIGEMLRIRYQHGFIRSLRMQGIEGFVHFPYRAFVQADAGRLQNSLGSEINRTNQAFQLFFTAVQWGIMAAVMLLIAATAHLFFTFSVLLGGGVVQFLFNRFYRQTKGLSTTLTTENHRYHRLLIQLISQFTYLKANARVGAFAKHMGRSVTDLEDKQMQLGRIHAVISALREPLVLLISVAALLYHHHIGGDSWPLLLGVFVVLYRGVQSIVEMQSHYNAFLGLTGSLNNVDAFLSEMDGFAPLEQGVERINAAGDIKLQSIQYAAGNTSIFTNFSASFSDKTLSLIVGQSGTGKSTLLHLISGLLRPESGNIHMGSDEYAGLNLTHLQQSIGYITQDPAVFADSVFNNVTFWDTCTEETMIRFRKAMSEASLLEWLNELPDLEETPIGHQGHTLSGGQRQRLAIARELYRRVDVLLFDEPTASLDEHTAKSIAVSITKLKQQATVIVATHQPDIFTGMADKTVSLE